MPDTNISQHLNMITMQLGQIQAQIVRMATKDDLKNEISRLELKMATKDDLKNEISRLELKMATKDDLKNLEKELKVFTHEEVGKLAVMIADTIAIPQTRQEEVLKKMETLPKRVEKLEVDMSQFKGALNLV